MTKIKKNAFALCLNAALIFGVLSLNQKLAAEGVKPGTIEACLITVQAHHPEYISVDPGGCAKGRTWFMVETKTAEGGQVAQTYMDKALEEAKSKKWADVLKACAKWSQSCGN